MAAGINYAKANTFINVKFDASVKVMLDNLEMLTKVYDRQDTLIKIVKRAAQPIKKHYKSLALAHDVTGNLAASTRIKTKKYPNGGAVAIAGPRQTGSGKPEMKSGNHAWLVEFGSDGRRKPSTRMKKTYINVHKMVNKKMKLHTQLEDSEKFAKRAKGFYFIMSSEKEPTRQARKGAGYPHDFFMALSPDETYGEMPAYGLMEKTIKTQTSKVSSIMSKGLTKAINDALASGGSGT